MRRDKLIHNLIYNKEGTLRKSVFFAFVLFFAVGVFFFMTYLSAFSGGDGSSGNPYRISTCSELQNIENDVGANYILINSINCSETKTWNDGKGFRPIGNSSGFQQQFNGVLNGGGYNITGLYIKRPNENFVGLFRAFLNFAEVKNIKLIDVNVTGNRSVGSLLGSDMSGGEIIDTYVSGSVYGYRFVGGLVGGQMVGDASSIISRSYSEVKVTGTGNNYIGGLVGLSLNGIISNSYARGNVTGNFVVAGLVGTFGGQITHSYATGKITGAGATGGLAAAGGVNPTVTASFWDTQTSGQATSNGGTGKTTAQMKTESTFTDAGWNFDNVWDMDSGINAGYPYLLVRLFAGGDGSSGNPYQISSCSELQNIKTNLTANYVLINNVDCKGTISWDGGEGFEPIPSSGNFAGVLKGRNFSILNLYINRNTSSYVGLFRVANGTLENVRLKNTSILGYSYVGGLVGYAVYDNLLIKNSSVSGNITGVSKYVGGLVGVGFNSEIIDSYFNGSVSSINEGFIGGLVGYSNEMVINKSYTLYSKVIGKEVVGGLVGQGITSRIIDSYFNGSVIVSGGSAGGVIGNIQSSTILNRTYSVGNVSGDIRVGGLAGTHFSGVIENSYARGNVSGGSRVGGLVGENQATIINSYSTGKVTANSYLGGLVGFTTIYATNSFWDTQTSGQAGSAGGTGKTTAQMKTKSTFTNAGWNFTSIWDINSGVNDGYPFLNLREIRIFSPKDGGSLSNNNSIILNYTVFFLNGEDVCWYNVFNSTKDQVIGNTTISGCTNSTFSLSGDEATYNLTLYSNDTLGNIYFARSEFAISIDKPAINLDSPIHYSNLSSGNNIYFNYTATDSDGLDTCQLWGSWSGWSKKYTWIGPTSGVMNYTTLSVSEGDNYKWNVKCNDSFGFGGFSFRNNTFTVDLTNPIMDITSPANDTTMPGGQLIVTINYNVSDTHFKECYFTLRTKSGTLHHYAENTTMSCTDGSKTISTLYYGTFVLKLWAEDYAGNLGSDSVTWTSVSSGGTGGVGTPGELTIVEVIVNETKTYCGDGICQVGGNDYGIQENFFNCPQDCPGFDLDTFVYSFTKYCFDNDPSTVCLMPLFSALPAGQSNIEPTKTTTFISVGVGLLLLLVILSFVKVGGPGGKKVTGYDYVKLKLRKRRR